MDRLLLKKEEVFRKAKVKEVGKRKSHILNSVSC